MDDYCDYELKAELIVNEKDEAEFINRLSKEINLLYEKWCKLLRYPKKLSKVQKSLVIETLEKGARDIWNKSSIVPDGRIFFGSSEISGRWEHCDTFGQFIDCENLHYYGQDEDWDWNWLIKGFFEKCLNPEAPSFASFLINGILNHLPPNKDALFIPLKTISKISYIPFLEEDSKQPEKQLNTSPDVDFSRLH
jgi:hypothetical protein